MGKKEATQKKGIILNLNPSDLEGKTITGFYALAAGLLGVRDEDVAYYDCRKICVGGNIQDGIIETYRQASPEAFEKHPSDAMQSVMRSLLCYGPKVDPELKDNQVRVEDGFIEMVNA